jgi:hypothetical protein
MVSPTRRGERQVSGVRYDFPLAVLPRSFGQTLRFRIMTSAMMSVMAIGMVVWNSGIGCDGVTPREAVAVITCACLSGMGGLASVSGANGQSHVKETYYCNTLARDPPCFQAPHSAPDLGRLFLALALAREPLC